jgi:hypothetical protein
MLPSKTIPEVGGKGRPHTLKVTVNSRTITAPPTKKARPARPCSGGIGEDEVKDEDRSRNITMMNASFSSTSSFQIMNTKKVCSLSCHAQFDSNQRSEGPKYEKEPGLFILQSCLKHVQWFSRRHRRCALLLFSWRAHKICTIKKSMKSNLNGAF